MVQEFSIKDHIYSPLLRVGWNFGPILNLKMNPYYFPRIWLHNLILDQNAKYLFRENELYSHTSKKD